MGVTYTNSRERATWRGGWSHTAVRHQLGLTAVSIVSLLALLVCYAGRMRAFDLTEQARRGPAAVDVTEVSSATALEPALALAFDSAADRRFAARELLDALTGQGERLDIANVGALSRIRVPVERIRRARGLDAYADRIRQAEASASVPLFTASELAAIKPALVVRTREHQRRTVFWCAVAFLAAFQLVSFVWHVRGVPGDRLLLAGAHLLATLGFLAMLARPDPLRDTLLVVRYTQGVVIGLAVCAAASLVNIRRTAILRLSYLSLGAAVLLGLVLIAFGSGPGTSGAKVNLGPVQPVEAIRLLIAIFLAGYLGRRWELVRQLRETSVKGRRVPAWMNLPRVAHVAPLVGGVAVSLVLFFALRDLGPALLLSLTFMMVLAVARAGVGAVLAGVAVLFAGFYLGYWTGISGTLAARVAMWQSPWENAVRGGDQLAHAMWSMATGALAGTGLGFGDTRYLPEGHTDLVLAAVAEELGAAGVLVAVAACALIGWRGFRIARAAPNDTSLFLALAMTLSLVTPMLVMAAGMLALVPLTGIATPFLSYGGSAMTANFAALGLLAAIASDRERPVDIAPFRPALTWMGRGLVVAGAVMLIVWARVQVFAADRFLVRPQLGLQADGGRRYQYNPRVLDAAGLLPRGSVLDRRGLPLAAAPDVVHAAEGPYARVGISVRQVCSTSADRCYPLGGRAFHVLGNERTRANWAATNTSYVERDAEDTLRGFDDGADSTLVVRRDYGDVVPLVRHRWQPRHEDVQMLMNRPRDVRLTLDARLQSRVADATSGFAAAAGLRHAAVVVLDASTGELLASVSYPWPASKRDIHSARRTDVMLDRARYGLYPPGSTFKLVTAAAALRGDPALTRVPFSCSLLRDGRVGVRIPGSGRPVRDDILHRRPHGAVTMREGLVHSCNAYFGQLAWRVGAESLAETAEAAGIRYPIAGSPERVRESLPHAGYGQGPVLATPLRMARVAAAIGTDGRLREPSIVGGAPAPSPKPFLGEPSARQLAAFMRDAVDEGSGWRLRKHPGRIAGKTGTAEVDGAASHAWFVGFAPYGPATRRIAFAVLLENAGYGGGPAAALAADVVSAAASLGYVQ
jgi:cell division protein FtsW (lipid II flippase)